MNSEVQKCFRQVLLLTCASALELNHRSLSLRGQQPLELRRPKPGLLHHTDRGAHYTSERYQAQLQAYGMIRSMSRIANCLDNAAAESFFSTLKNELTLHERFKTRAEGRAAIFDFLEMFYNPVRQHSYLDGLSPLEFEKITARLTMCP